MFNIHLLAKDRAGAAAVEFAIVAPIFIFLMFGVIAYGIYFGAALSVQQLAADAARVAVAGLNVQERTALAQAYIDRNVGEYALLDRKYMRLELRDSRRDPTQFRVSVEYDAKALPIWNLHTPLPLPGSTIVRGSTVRLGGT